MKVGIVLSQPFGNSIGTDVRVNGLLQGLTKLGVEIHLITPYSGFFRKNEDNIFVHKIPSLSSQFHITNLTYWLTKRLFGNPFLFRKLTKNKSLLIRNARTFSKGIYEIANKLELDILQAEQPIASIACVSLRDKLSIPFVADFHGVWAEEMVASGFVTYGDKYYKSLFEVEEEIAQSADAVTVVSDEMSDYIVHSFGISAKKVALVPNATFPRVSEAKTIKSPTKIIHSGTLHPWEKVELFIQSMPFVLEKCPSAQFYLTRKGAKLKKIMRLANTLRVNPYFFWYSNAEDFFNFMKNCDVGIISSTDHIARKMAYPAKLYDYLSIGLPIIANKIGAWDKIISQNKVGIIVENNPEAFADGILQLLENPEFARDCSQRGIELVKEHLNYYKSAARMLDLYKRLT